MAFVRRVIKRLTYLLTYLYYITVSPVIERKALQSSVGLRSTHSTLCNDFVAISGYYSMFYLVTSLRWDHRYQLLFTL